MRKEVRPIESYTLQTYLTDNYLTLLLLASLAMLLIVNRRMKIQGLHYVWTIIGIVFLLTLCEALEDMCDLYGWNNRILYFKTALVYWFYPLTAMLELYLVAPIRHRMLTSIPYCICAVLVFIDLFDTRMIYYFNENHHYLGGPLTFLPVMVVVFYVLLLGYWSVHILKSGARSKGVIVIFMTVTSILTALGEEIGFAWGYSEAATAIEMMIYYFFLSAIGFSETQEKLYQSRLELERQRIKLLVTQMQPHFIFNSLAAIQSLCYTDSETAADCIQVFGDYLRSNINSLSSDEPIEFASELEHIDQYVKLEKASTDVEFTMIYELEIRDFKVPPLTVQPIVENAIKHGALTRRDGTGAVKIRTEDTGRAIRITVTDNGIGASLTSKQKEHQSVGIENVRQRLTLQCGGSLDVKITESGAVSVIIIPKSKERVVRRMYIIGVDDRRSIVTMLEKMLSEIDPDGEHRFYTDPIQVIRELDKPVEVAFLDVEMPGMDGIQLAKRIISRYPLCNIIFLTGYSEYMPNAFEIHASGYVLKPFSKKKIEEALQHRRYRVPDLSDRPVKVQCFGNFEVFVGGEAVKFKRQKSKELLAYLIDRRGALCTTDMLIGNLEPEQPSSDSEKSKIRVYIADLINTFFQAGIDGLIIKQGGVFGVDTRFLDCDYYRYMDGDPYAISRYVGEYMTQYGFAEETRAFLEKKYNKEHFDL